jgi:hypothetical protein
MMGLVVPVTVTPPGLEVTVYVVMVAPPLWTGAVNGTIAYPSPATAVPMTGASGTVAGVTLFEGADAALVPALLVAVTVNV